MNDDARLAAITLRKSLAQPPSSSFRREAAACDRMLRENLRRVFGEPDAALRMNGIEDLWTAMPVAYAGDLAVAGRQAVSDIAAAFLAGLGGARCETVGRLAGNSGAFILRWEARDPTGAPSAAGCHLAFFREGRIDSLYLFDEVV